MLNELRNELKTSLEQDDMPTTVPQEDKDIDLIIATVESSQQAIRFLIEQIKRNNEWFNKYGIATTLEYYDFNKEEIKTVIEKHEDKKIHSALNKKFIDKINKFFSNILDAVVKGFKKILDKNNNDIFEEHIDKIINKLKDSEIDYDKCNKDTVKEYLKKHGDILKIAVLKGAKTLSGAQYKIITEFYNLQESLHYTSLLLDNIDITNKLINDALYAYRASDDENEVINKIVATLTTILDTIAFISNYNLNLPQGYYWDKLKDVENLNKDKNKLVIPLGLDSNNIYGIVYSYNEQIIKDIKKVIKKPEITELKNITSMLSKLWDVKVISISLSKIKADTTTLTPQPLTLEEMNDLLILYKKIDNLITVETNHITEKINDLYDQHTISEDIAGRHKLYDPELETILLSLLNYRINVYNNIVFILLEPANNVIDYMYKLPVVINYAELSTKCYTKEG